MSTKKAYFQILVDSEVSFVSYACFTFFGEKWGDEAVDHEMDL